MIPKKLATLFGLAVLAVVFVLAMGATAGPGTLQSPGFGVQVEINPTEQEAVYRCKAVVTDLTTEEVVAAPNVTFAAGEEARMRSSQSPGPTVDIVVTVNPEETEAHYSASITSGESVVSTQKVTVKLGSHAGR